MLCGSPELGDATSINDGWQMRVCHHCDVGVTWPIPTDAEMRTINIDEYPVDDRVRIYRSRAAEFQARWDQLLELIEPRPVSVLDVGCNLGFFLDHARERGIPRVAGAEINEACRSWGVATLGVDIRNSIEDFGDERFEAILLQDVLEHLKDPLGFLLLCLSKLDDGGSIVVQSPNRNSEMARQTGGRWAWYSAPDHLVHLTPRSMRWLAARADLGIETLRTADSRVDVLLASHPWIPERASLPLRRVPGLQRLRMRSGDEGGLLQAILVRHDPDTAR